MLFPTILYFIVTHPSHNVCASCCFLGKLKVHCGMCSSTCNVEDLRVQALEKVIQSERGLLLISHRREEA